MMSIMNWISLIVGIISVVLAVVSIVFSAMFYKWSKEENKDTSKLTTTINEKVLCLERLFDKMFDSTYDMVKENNRAMQNQLFPGSFSQQALINNDMEVFLAVQSAKNIKITELATKVKLTEVEVTQIAQKMQVNGYLKIEGDTVLLNYNNKTRNVSSSSESEIE